MNATDGREWRVGDRVQRRENVYQPSRWMHGSVIEVTHRSVPHAARKHFPDGREPLFTVEWDDGWIGRGYLSHGLRLSTTPKPEQVDST